MQRKTVEDIFLPIDDHIFPIKSQICILRRNKERIQKVPHIGSSMLFRRYSPTLRLFINFGKHSSFSEQALHPPEGLTLGV